MKQRFQSGSGLGGIECRHYDIWLGGDVKGENCSSSLNERKNMILWYAFGTDVPKSTPNLDKRNYRRQKKENVWITYSLVNAGVRIYMFLVSAVRHIKTPILRQLLAAQHLSSFAV
jgi:hypothetical protein